jgi:acetyltransferase-like isoleucine patch superfamily enzyme
MQPDHPDDRAVLGEGTMVEPNVRIGVPYHRDAGIARIGKHGILRSGTIIYGDVVIGDYFQTGHHAVIRAKTRIGDYCTLFHHSVIEGIVRLGTGVRIMAHVYIPTRTWFGDHVFVGPGTTFLNDRSPGRYETLPTPRGATVEDDVMIGGGCTILPGVRIGARSFVAAGSVVTRDVPPRSLVRGVPGRSEPLPAHLDRPNHRQLTLQPIDLWHPGAADWNAAAWPADWPETWDH